MPESMPADPARVQVRCLSFLRCSLCQALNYIIRVLKARWRSEAEGASEPKVRHPPPVRRGGLGSRGSPNTITSPLSHVRRVSRASIGSEGPLEGRSPFKALLNQNCDVIAQMEEAACRQVAKGLSKALPRSSQRELLPRDFQGLPRIEPQRLERFAHALHASHRQAAHVLLVHQGHADGVGGQNPHAWRGRHIPVGALPMLLLVPACMSCDSTRQLVVVIMLIHFFWALILTLTSKLCGSTET